MDTFRQLDCRHGSFTVFAQDTYVGRSMAEYGEWSEIELWLLRQIVRAGDVVVEIGANIGAHTVPLSRMVGDAGRVIAFEPARLTHQLLCSNLVINRCLNVRAERMAVGARSQHMVFPELDPHQANNFGAASLSDHPPGDHQPRGTGEPVWMTTLDAWDLPRVDCIKADMEGAEPDMLRGAMHTIRRHRPVVCAEIDVHSVRNPSPTGNRDELITLLNMLDYRSHYFFAPVFNPDNGAGKVDDVFNAYSLNLVAVPHERAAIDGLSEAAVGDTAFRMLDPKKIWMAVHAWERARFRWL